MQLKKAGHGIAVTGSEHSRCYKGEDKTPARVLANEHAADNCGINRKNVSAL